MTDKKVNRKINFAKGNDSFIDIEDKNVDFSDLKTDGEGNNPFIEEMEIISKDRGETYGPVKDHFEKVAAMWTQYLGYRITAHDVPVMIALLKIVRISETPNHHDSHIDIANFIKIADELNDG